MLQSCQILLVVLGFDCAIETHECVFSHWSPDLMCRVAVMLEGEPMPKSQIQLVDL